MIIICFKIGVLEDDIQEKSTVRRTSYVVVLLCVEFSAAEKRVDGPESRESCCWLLGVRPAPERARESERELFRFGFAVPWVPRFHPAHQQRTYSTGTVYCTYDRRSSSSSSCCVQRCTHSTKLKKSRWPHHTQRSKNTKTQKKQRAAAPTHTAAAAAAAKRSREKRKKSKNTSRKMSS